MIKYRNPLKEGAGASRISADLVWPNEYEYPSFSVWSQQSRGAIFRNLIALHLHEHEVPMVEIAVFLGISDSRARIVVKTTGRKLFGERWAYLPQVFAHTKKHSPSPLSTRTIAFYERHLQARIEAVLYALNRVGHGRVEETELFSRAGILIAQHKHPLVNMAV